MHPIVGYRVWSAHALDIIAAGLLNILIEVAIDFLNLLDFHVNAKCPSDINSEAAQQWLPEGVLLYALLRQAPKYITQYEILALEIWSIFITCRLALCDRLSHCLDKLMRSLLKLHFFSRRLDWLY